MDEMKEYKDQNLEKLMRPNNGYCTFKTAEAFNKLLELQRSIKEEPSLEHLKYRDEDLKFKRAIQPTNVLWENMEFTR